MPLTDMVHEQAVADAQRFESAATTSAATPETHEVHVHPSGQYDFRLPVFPAAR